MLAALEKEMMVWQPDCGRSTSGCPKRSTGFSPTRAALENLAREGIDGTGGRENGTLVPAGPDRSLVIHVGDVMYDAALVFGRIADEKSRITESFGLKPKSFALVTCHRAENTDDPPQLESILEALE